MKKVILLSVALVAMVAWKQNDKALEVDKPFKYPRNIAKIFKAHGGIETFNEKKTLVFEIENPKGNEKHTTDLKTRHARIETDKYALGYDGNEAWLVQDSTYFKSDPRFYHNLMFYFYTMPFVFGDDGITYTKVDDLVVGDKKYKGYKISYADGVGDSSKDNYYLYYDKKTREMKYLGYTVTFFSKKSSDKINLIEYSEWEDVDGLKLPKTLKWRVFKDGKIGEVRNEVNFVNAKFSTEALDSKFFAKPNK